MSTPKAERTAALAALKASADKNGGTPVFKAVETLTGVPRTNLRRWWSDHVAKKATVHVLRAPAADVPAGDGAALSVVVADATIEHLSMVPSVWHAWQYDQIVDDINAAKADAISALPALRKLQRETRDHFTAARVLERNVKTMTQAEQREHAKKVAAKMSPDVALIMVEQFRERGLA
jgi:hypothetical protein